MCRDNKGGNKETWHQQPLRGCVNIDSSTRSVYLAKSPGQRMFAFSSSGCVPGQHKENYMGEIGTEPPCKDIYDTFSQAPIASLLLDVNGWCNFQNFITNEDNLENILEILAEATT
ncbi:hypothetical protein W97_05832 [Coniosporium apollinis CBS 100218]|uniref:Uncharacterized protein n=1 Tax=Coniosporium apollinis (strain CBS 100218) TaxID=1168221 RepID=R7YY86_CONA1|nr:uncharacterized protein W97_05832 [Coniosporium apollinis CBS 100218]EON66586.1 hypothetical protein W97_05832 [Coniosporium apollinis CBS 100218]